MKLFSKKIEPACEYCEHGSRIGPDEVICVKKGVVAPYERCGAYRYAPLKRVPEPPAVFDPGVSLTGENEI